MACFGCTEESATNVQPNFTRILTMDRLSLNDTGESEHGDNFATITGPAKVSRPKLSKFVFDAQPVKRNPDMFKASRNTTIRSASCEVPDSLLEARAARIILRRGKSHRPPPTRYVRRQRSSMDPLMRIVDFDDGCGIEMSLIEPSARLPENEDSRVEEMIR